MISADALGCRGNTGKGLLINNIFLGRGPLFYSMNTVCGGNGGSNSGYGGVGLFMNEEDILQTCDISNQSFNQQCLYLTNTTRF